MAVEQQIPDISRHHGPRAAPVTQQTLEHAQNHPHASSTRKCDPQEDPRPPGSPWAETVGQVSTSRHRCCEWDKAGCLRTTGEPGEQVRQFPLDTCPAPSPGSLPAACSAVSQVSGDV